MPLDHRSRSRRRLDVAISAVLTFALAVQLAVFLLGGATGTDATLPIVLLAAALLASATLCAYEVWLWRTNQYPDDDQP